MIKSESALSGLLRLCPHIQLLKCNVREQAVLTDTTAPLFAAHSLPCLNALEITLCEAGLTGLLRHPPAALVHLR